MALFNAYIKLDDHRYREHFGLCFEEFAVGQKFHHRPGVTLSQQDNKDEALDVTNISPLYYDAEFAAKTDWKKNICANTLTLQNTVGMTWKTFGKKQRIIAYDLAAMLTPVIPGDTLYTESEILEISEYSDDPDLGLLKVETLGKNQRQEIVSRIIQHMLVYKKGKHPLDQQLPAGANRASDKKFASHRQLDDGSFIEEVGIFYEDFEVGEIFEHRPGRTFTYEESRIHSLRSLDWSPQFINLDYANELEKLYQGKKPINETFFFAVITGLTTRTFARAVSNVDCSNINLHSIIFDGDTVYVESEILRKDESKRRSDKDGFVETATRVHNQRGDLLCAYKRHFYVYRKDLGPYQAAGY
jgi:itaconyl-CoA hydratase